MSQITHVQVKSPGPSSLITSVQVVRNSQKTRVVYNEGGLEAQFATKQGDIASRQELPCISPSAHVYCQREPAARKAGAWASAPKSACALLTAHELGFVPEGGN